MFKLMRTSIFGQLPTIDLILHHVGPKEGTLAKMKVKGNSVPQARDQHTELSLIQINAADFVAI